MIYCSTDAPNIQWGQSYPKKTSPENKIYCNGRPCKVRDWKHSLQSHRNKAQQYATVVSELLGSLPSEYRILKGCISNPRKNENDWRIFKRRFNQYRSRFIRRQKCEFNIVAKLHIVRSQSREDIHFDYVGYTSLQWSERRIRNELLRWIDAAGGKRRTSSCKLMTDRSQSNLEDIANYLYKFAPDESNELAGYQKYFILPATRFPVTWQMGNFFRHKPAIIEQQRYWDDELQVVSKKISGFAQLWNEYIRRICGSKIPKFTTPEFRQRHRANKYIERFLDMNQINCGITTGKNEWKNALNLAWNYPGFRYYPVNAICPNDTSGDWVIEIGESTSIADRMKGKYPVSYVGTTLDRDRLIEALCPREEYPDRRDAKPVEPPQEWLTNEEFMAELEAM